jgi:alkylated DNA repair dioxygenase AlkB
MSQLDAFAIAGGALVQGFFYEPDFLIESEEAALLHEIRKLPLQEAEYKQYRARRRIQSYGARYDYTANRLNAADPIAPFLHPLRQRIADWTHCRAEDFTQALVAEYSPGTPLGWHRDVPEFELVVGVSLAAPGTMRFRRYPPQLREPSVALSLAPRSVYRLVGEARWQWQHRIVPMPGLRYSITFRTLRT